MANIVSQIYEIYELHQTNNRSVCDDLYKLASEAEGIIAYKIRRDGKCTAVQIVGSGVSVGGTGFLIYFGATVGVQAAIVPGAFAIIGIGVREWFKSVKENTPKVELEKLQSIIKKIDEILEKYQMTWENIFKKFKEIQRDFNEKTFVKNLTDLRQNLVLEASDGDGYDAEKVERGIEFISKVVRVYKEINSISENQSNLRMLAEKGARNRNPLDSQIEQTQVDQTQPLK